MLTTTVTRDQKEMLAGVLGAVYNDYTPYVADQVEKIINDDDVPSDKKFEGVYHKLLLTRGNHTSAALVARVIFVSIGMSGFINWDIK